MDRANQKREEERTQEGRQYRVVTPGFVNGRISRGRSGSSRMQEMKMMSKVCEGDCLLFMFRKCVSLPSHPTCSSYKEL